MRGRRPRGIAKRPPSYVPVGFVRDGLMKMSKADLAEILYDFAVQQTGCDPLALVDHWQEIVRRRDVVKAARP